MTHVVTQPCCADASCVSVCPVDCIHPAPGEPDFMTADMLYIDPGRCVDCGLCAKACPVDAIARDFHLTSETAPFLDLNAAYYQDAAQPTRTTPRPRETIRIDPNSRPPQVAIVGSGPAAMFAAAQLQARSRAHIDMFERLPAAGGLVRYGVAPDHQDTKKAGAALDRVLDDPRFRLFSGVEVGQTISHEQLASHYHAVIYATGAPQGRRLGIPGEGLAGCHTADQIVGWYNGHPHQAARDVDLSTDRAIVIGNGNVALDVARVLLSDAAQLRTTDVSDTALNALAHSEVREVVIVGRRGPEDAAGTAAELIGLASTPGVSVHTELDADSPPGRLLSDPMRAKKTDLILGFRGEPASERRATLMFSRTPVEIVGDSAVQGIRLAPTQAPPEGSAARTVSETVLSCGLVVEAIGFHGSPIDGLPFDETTGRVPHVDGRVTVVSTPGAAGIYVAGWVKRGSSGGIGQNKRCAEETVDALLADYESGRLPEPTSDDIAQMLQIAPRARIGM